MSHRSNILFILADQFRSDCIGAAGNRIIRTPNLDELARNGVLFSNAFVQTSPCGPSRMCIYTGRYMCSTRSVDNMTPLTDAEENLGMYLRERGYVPGIIGYNDYAIDPRVLPEGDSRKNALNYSNFLPGFEVILQHEYHSPEYFAYLRERGYPDDLCGPRICSEYNVPPDGPGPHLPLRYPAHYKAEDSESQFVTSKAVEYIRDRAGQGWFLSVNYIKPHPPRICPAPYNTMYDPAAMPYPTRRASELENPHPYLRRARLEPALVEERALQETQACYYGMVTEIDACVGRLLDALKETGQWENTLVLFSSDHGEYLGDHYFTDKGHFYDATMRVPFILRDPSPEAAGMRGQVLDHFVESIDAAPTFLEFLGMPIPGPIQGTSVLGLVRRRPTAPHKSAVFFEFDFRNLYKKRRDADPDECLLWVIRDDRHKYVQFGPASMPPLLFDLRKDEGEFVNFAEKPEYASVVAAYCQKLLRWRMKHEDQRMEHWAARYR